MTREEALEMLKHAPADSKPSKVNPQMTRKMVVDVVREATELDKPGSVLSYLSEKRVLQACQDRRRPRYD